MTDTIVREDKDVDRVLNKAAHGIDHGTAYKGQSYEEGLQDMHSWLTREDADEPLEGIALEADEDDEPDDDEDDEKENDEKENDEKENDEKEPQAVRV